MKDKDPLNKLNKDEKIISRVEPELETDDFSEAEAKRIVEMVGKDAKIGKNTKIWEFANI